MKTNRQTMIKDLNINKERSTFGCTINRRNYIGSFTQTGSIFCIQYARNIYCKKQTTLRIRMKIENELNKFLAE